MCGRFVNVAETGDLVDEFDVEQVLGEDPGTSWNIAPTDEVRIVLDRAPGRGVAAHAVRQLRTARWGLVPSWARDARSGARMINARIETLAVKPSFKAALARRRCLVPALGYYEWGQTAGGKRPRFLHEPDGALLAMAGLYELWRDGSRADDDPGRWLWTCAIVTQQASDLLGEIHDRNPVVVPRDLRADWLDCNAHGATGAAELLARMPPARLESRPVSPAVGNVRNNGPQLIEPVPVDTPPAQQRLQL